MLDDGPSVCERCGGELRRVLYPTGIIFKGSGFYKTDSRSASSATVGGGTARSATDTEGSKGSSDAASEKKASNTSKPAGGEKDKKKASPG
jgi:predicted nucleic acid-binding Zn ribbon protein